MLSPFTFQVFIFFGCLYCGGVLKTPPKLNPRAQTAKAAYNAEHTPFVGVRLSIFL